MSDPTSMFDGAGWRTTIEQYASQNGWKIDEIDDEHAALAFEMEESGREYVIDITRFESTLEFWVPSTIELESEEDLPQEVAVTLLRRNAESKIGFWCLAETDDGLYLGYMHNAEIELLTAEYFGDIISKLLEECDAFEDVLEELEGDEGGGDEEEA